MPLSAGEELVGWLHRAALADEPLDRMLGGFCAELAARGFELARSVIGGDTPHPTLDGYFFVWRPQEPAVKLIEYTRDQSESDAQIARTLAPTYLGRDISPRVLDGAIVLGRV
ncbi:MAG: hypothetical protein FJX57_08395 [Alphaproteobacteria bacterium]|nr:hypothetical protein [Alphaproteobacteria bacterium]